MEINRIEQVRRLEKLFKVYVTLPAELKEVLGNAKALSIAQLTGAPEYNEIVQKLEELREKFCPDYRMPVADESVPMPTFEALSRGKALINNEPVSNEKTGELWDARVDEFLEWCQRGKALPDVVKWAKEGIEQSRIITKEEDLKVLFEIPKDATEKGVAGDKARRRLLDMHLFLKNARLSIGETSNPYILQKLYELVLEREDEICENAHKALLTSPVEEV